MTKTLRHLAFAVALPFGLATVAQAQGATQQNPQQGIAIDPQVARPGGDLPGDPKIELELVADGLIDPVNVASAGDGRLFVVERVGRIRILDENGQLLEEPFLDLQDTVMTGFLEQGLLGLAFHPNYAENGRFYVNYTDAATNGDQWVVEYQVSADDPNLADAESARVLFTLEEPYRNHNGGTMHFGPDGHLYIAVGDGGLAADPYENAQDISTLLGTILRIDVDAQGDNLGYGIPAGNPFAEAGVQAQVEDAPSYHPDALPEIWAYGLRNPWQFSFDSETGEVYIADVGQSALEEVNVVPSGDTEDAYNFGWDVMEGTLCFPSETTDAQEGDDCLVGTLPVAEYSHDEGDCSITGIGVYRGNEFPELDGIYFNSDYCSGKVWGLARDEAGNWQYEVLQETELLVTGSGTNATGDVYLTSCECTFGGDYNPYESSNGKVWRIVAAGAAQGGAQTGGSTAGGAGPTGGEGLTDMSGGAGTDAPLEQQEQEGEGENQGQQQGQQVNLQALMDQGDAIYHSVATPTCASCHGADGEGGVGPALAGNQELQDTSYVLNHILYGEGIMPAFNDQLSDEQIAAVATYVRNAWGNDFGAITAEQVRQAR